MYSVHARTLPVLFVSTQRVQDAAVCTVYTAGRKQKIAVQCRAYHTENTTCSSSCSYCDSSCSSAAGPVVLN
jgi:hypothetical protein